MRRTSSGAALALCFALAADAAAQPSATFLRSWGARGSAPGQFISPYGVACSPSGEVYVADCFNNRVQVFDANGGFLRTWGTYGSASGQFRLPTDVAVASDGSRVYVSDLSNYRVQIFTPSGSFVGSFGSYGSGNGQFRSPYRLAVSATGHVYVTDLLTARVQKFTATGTWLLTFGSFGSGDGQFRGVFGVGAFANGNVVVGDLSERRLQVFDAQGQFLRKWKSGPDTPGYPGPNGLEVDAYGRVWVALLTREVVVFASSGARIMSWGFPYVSPPAPGEPLWPTDVALSSAGQVYVVSHPKDRVSIYDANPCATFPLESPPPLAGSWGGYGSGPAQFTGGVSGVAVDDARDVVYTSDWGNHRVQRFTRNGGYRGSWGGFGTGPGEFRNPYDLDLDAAGNLYVLDYTNHRIQKLDPDGNHLQTIAAGIDAYGFDVAADGRVFVTRLGPHQVQIYAADGTFQQSFSGFGLNAYPLDVVGTAVGDFYVLFGAQLPTTNPNEIRHYSAAGALLSTWGSGGSCPLEFDQAIRLTRDSAGDFYVSDYFNTRVQKLRGSDGAFLCEWGNGDPALDLRFVSGVGVGADGSVYVTEQGGSRIVKYGSALLAAPPVSSDGIAHSGLGGASLAGGLRAAAAVEGDGGGLFAAPIGPSGEDGFAVEAGGCDGIEVTWGGGFGLDAASDSGASFTQHLKGVVEGSPSTLLAIYSETVEGDSIRLACDFTNLGAPAETIEVRSLGTVAHRASYPAGQAVYLIAPGSAEGPVQTVRGSLGSVAPWNAAGTGRVLTVGATFSADDFDIRIGHTVVTGDEIRFTPVGGREIQSIEIAEFRAVNPAGGTQGAMPIAATRLVLGGWEWRGLGGARLSSAGAAWLSIAELDSTGTAGASVDLGEAPAFSALWSGLDLLGFGPQQLTLWARGALDGVTDQAVATIATTAGDSALLTAANFPAAPGAPQTLEILDGETVLVSATASAPAIVHVAASDAVVVRAESLAIELRWDRPETIAIVGGAGYTGDGARWRPSGALPDVAHLETVEVTAANLLALSLRELVDPVTSGIPAGEAAPAGSSRLSFGPLRNPARLNDGAIFALDLPAAARVEARLFDVSGRLVRVLHDGLLPAGRTPLAWDGRMATGRVAAPGVYFALARAGSATVTAKCVLVR